MSIEQSIREQEIDIEEAMEKVGQSHKYQKIVLIASMLGLFLVAYSFMMITYYLSPPAFECFKDGIWSSCDEDSGACDSNVISHLLYEKNRSISAELDLYCSKRIWRTVIQSMPFFGCVLGTLTFNFLSDNKGRTLAIQICWTIGSIFSLILNFAVNIPMLMIGAFGLGLGVQPLGVLLLVHSSELSSGKFRVVGVILLQVVWSLNEIQYIWMIDVLPNWKWCTFFFFTLPFCILNIYPFTFLHDSPRFLYSKNRQKCLKTLNYIAKVNKKEQISNEELTDVAIKYDKIYSYLDLFRYKSQRVNTILLNILFVTPHVLYYGIQVSLDQLGSSFGYNSLIIGISELVGYFISNLISHKYPRKLGTFFTILVTCLISISFYFYSIPSSCSSESDTCWQKIFQSVMLALARCVVSVTFSVVIIWCGESYPTTLRSVGFGLSFAYGYFGSFLAPYVVDTSNRIGINPMVSLGVLTLSGCVAALFLKETIGQPIQQDIPELQQIDSSKQSLLLK
ncbi:MFS transporter (macronuclear) [Tetrahymena thermophila SB210]|uniref:MFS transporter n=1 Tax=Tetrahymena thermophila (strain SB210) TaxID=312017 RepID=I7MEY2_TETTS|nr:MFS transporter [Tetrahymena thermophila SB210]EAR98022.1 MFS transporter [Tetrahymena thermophila SB210]|eukprot:XP_001018267.1 MFS transporter [Tetrahymena thermophila SB210]